MTHKYIAATQQPQYETKDSGQRDEFSSGMLREPDIGRPRFDVLVPETVPFDEQLLARCAAPMERGAQKYSPVTGRRPTPPLSWSTHERCGHFRSRPQTKDHPGYTLVCGRSAGHSVLKCWDPSWEEDGYFIAPERKGFPKIQPLGVRKLTPIAAELRDTLEQLREFLDPDDVNCGVSPQLRKDGTVQMYLSTWVEGPVARALAAIDSYWRASEQGREAAQ